MPQTYGYFVVGETFVINCKHRTDRKVEFKKHAKKKRLKYRLFNGTYIEEKPQKGKLISHLRIIKYARKKRLKTVMILEDDALILTPDLQLPRAPMTWDMLYLGGNVQRVFDDEETNASRSWKRVSCLTSHAYIINRSMYDLIISEALKLKETGESDADDFEYDKWLCKTIHEEMCEDNNEKPKHRVYMITPEYIIQRNGYSDTRKTYVTYNQQITKNTDESVTELDAAELSVQENDEGVLMSTLKLPDIPPEDLPYVTILTPTRNCKEMFYFTIRNFFKFKYPKHKLQWIIADDGDVDKKVRELLPQDDRIKYINCKITNGKHLSITKKLNMSLSHSSDKYSVILHMFDNVYYPPLSVISRVKTLMSYNESSNKKCVGCTSFGVFDIVKNRSYESYVPDSNNNQTIMRIGSLAYTRDFWNERKWDEGQFSMESYHFIKGRSNQCITIPFTYVMFALDYDGKLIKNVDYLHTDKTDESQDEKSVNYFDAWDQQTQQFILLLRETIEV